MRRPPTRPYILNPESIALTDMIMNLFIFFFVSFSLLYTFNPERASRLEVKLPKASTGKVSPESMVTVTVTKDGGHFLGESRVSEDKLGSELKNLVKRQPGVSIMIRADESSPCRALVSVFDACRAAGIARTSFAVQQKNVP